jgi:hypothetical protein
VLFPTTGSQTGVVLPPTGSNLTVLNTGVYEIDFELPLVTSSSTPTFQLLVNGSAVAGGTYAGQTGTPIHGQAIVSLNAGDSLELRSNGTALTVLTASGGVSASIRVVRIS